MAVRHRLSRSCWCAQAGHQMSLCVEHMACCLFGAMCSHVDCLSPPILLLNHCSVAPAVSPSLPSFVSLYSLLVSAVLCWSVVFHVSTSCVSVSCLTVLQSSACLPACLPACFSPSGWFLLFICFILLLKITFSAFESSTSSIPCDRTDQPEEDSAEN